MSLFIFLNNKMFSHILLGIIMTWMIMLFVTPLVMVMKVDWLTVRSCVLSILIIITTTTAPVMVQSLLIAVRSILVQVKINVHVTMYMSVYLDGQSSGSSRSVNDDDDDGDDSHVYPGVIAAGLLVFIIVGIVGIILIVIKKKKANRRSPQAESVAVATPPQPAVVFYTNPSVPSQAPVSNQSYPNPVYAQQQTPQSSTGNEAVVTSVTPQAAAFNPNYHGAGHASAVGFTSNQSALPDGNMLEVDPPTYSACAGEGAPDGSTNNQSNLLPPDYTSACTSVPIPPATNN